MSNSQVVRSLQPRLPQLKYPQVSIRTAAQLLLGGVCVVHLIITIILITMQTMASHIYIKFRLHTILI